MIELIMISAYIVLLINKTIQERKNRKAIFTLKDTFFVIILIILFLFHDKKVYLAIQFHLATYLIEYHY